MLKGGSPSGSRTALPDISARVSERRVILNKRLLNYIVESCVPAGWVWTTGTRSHY